MKKAISVLIPVIAMSLFISTAFRASVVSAQSSKGKSGGSAAAIYDTQCAKCHGKNGKGIESLQPPDFTDAKWQASVSTKALTDGIRNGKGVMPGFKDALSPTQLSAMVKYVRAFGAKPAAKK